MSTETANITSAKRTRHLKTGDYYMDVEVTYTRGRGAQKVEEVRKYGYPLGTATEEIQADIAKSLETRAAERAQAEAQAADDQAQAEADQTVAALEGMKVTQ